MTAQDRTRGASEGRKTRPGRRTILVAGLAIVMLAEGWAAPIRTARFDPLANPDDRRAYTFLRDRGPEGAVLELPMSVSNAEREMRYQYLTLWHGHRITVAVTTHAPEAGVDTPEDLEAVRRLFVRDQ